MPYDVTTENVCTVVSEALKAANKTDTLSADVTGGSGMGNPKEWDSLSFVAVFTAVGQAFEVDLEDDDAFHFRTIAGIEELLKEILDE